MHFNQIIYCEDQNDAVKFLQQKLNGVVRHYLDYIDFNQFDNNIIVSDGLEKSTKHFRDVVTLSGDQCLTVKSSDIDETFVFNLIENTKAVATLGAASINGEGRLPLKISESFSFSFEYGQKTMEKILVQMECSDPKQSFFQVSIFDGDSTKCLFNKSLRYFSFCTKRPNDVQASEYFLEIPLDNPEFDALGKKYLVTVKFLHASSPDAGCQVCWKNDYSPYKFVFKDTELFGSVNFFAY